MKRPIFLLLCISIVIIINAQDKQLQLDSLLQKMYTTGSFNGNALVAEKGKIIFEKSWGLANEQTGEKLTTQSVFELASVSKQFTAMAIVLLQKKGKLDYNDKMAAYIPELSFYGDITIKNLLTHTGGLPDYMTLFDKEWNRSTIATNQDMINLFQKTKPAPLFAPNDKWEYSNTGYVLLASIIERVSKQPLEDFLATNIFKPLGMKNTLIYRRRYRPQKVANYAQGYFYSDSLQRKITPDEMGKDHYVVYLDGILGDGMVNSTLEDLFKWDRALYTNQLVNDEDKTMIFSSVITKDSLSSNYGYGWGLSNNKKYGKIVAHSGGWGGYVTYIERQIDNDRTIILLQNNAGVALNPLIRDIRKIINNEPLDRNITVTAKDLDQYLGIYSCKEFKFKITITKKDNVLTAQATGQSSFPLTPFENHMFKFDAADITMLFNPGENKMNYKQGRTDIVFVKE